MKPCGQIMSGKAQHNPPLRCGGIYAQHGDPGGTCCPVEPSHQGPAGQQRPQPKGRPPLLPFSFVIIISKPVNYTQSRFFFRREGVKAARSEVNTPAHSAPQEEGRGPAKSPRPSLSRFCRRTNTASTGHLQPRAGGDIATTVMLFLPHLFSVSFLWFFSLINKRLRGAGSCHIPALLPSLLAALPWVLYIYI